MLVKSSNRTDILGMYTAVLHDSVKGKPFFESEEFSPETLLIHLLNCGFNVA